jgi:hypothetical protein
VVNLLKYADLLCQRFHPRGQQGAQTGSAGYGESMERTTPTPCVLVIGLDPYRVLGPWDPEPVATAIAASTATFAEQGIDVENCLVGLDGSDDVEDVVTAALASRPWECVVIGGGIRKAEELLEMFETIVNLVRRHAPGAAIAFNSTPADIVDAASRRLR